MVVCMTEDILLFFIRFILIIFIVSLFVYNIFKLKKKLKKIVFDEVKDEDLKLYNKVKKYSWKLREILFFIFLPILILLIFDYINKELYYLIPFTIIVFILLIFLSHFLYFYAKPVGIKEGRVSCKWIKYSKCGYKYNIYFEDINKSITDVRLYAYKEHPVVQRNDSVKVYKTKLGLIYMIPYK